jgi:hypothetical protein
MLEQAQVVYTFECSVDFTMTTKTNVPKAGEEKSNFAHTIEGKNRFFTTNSIRDRRRKSPCAVFNIKLSKPQLLHIRPRMTGTGTFASSLRLEDLRIDLRGNVNC